MSDKKKFIAIMFFLCLLEVFLFRHAITTNALFGDIGDGRFCNYVTDHWYKFLTGQEKIFDSNQFYPVKYVFTYSDLFLGLGPFYCLFRIMGMNLYNAFKYTIIIVHFIGSGGMLWLLRKKFRLSYFSSIIGTCVFSYANIGTIFLHPQYMAIFFLPYLVISIITFFQNINDSRLSRILIGIRTLIIFVLVFYTSAYTGYYTAIIIAVILITYSILDLKGKQLKVWIDWMRNNFIELIFYIAFSIILLIPFAICYIPVQNLSGGRAWDEVLVYLPTFSDFFSINSWNWMYGTICNLGISAATSAVENGFPLFTFAFFVFSLIKLYQLYHRNKNNIENKLIYTFGISVVIISLLILKFRPNASLWYFVYKYLPGASSMRAVGTFMLMLPLLIAICIAYILNGMKRTKRLYLFSVIILLQYVWAGNLGMYWNIDDRLNFLQSISPMPDDCCTIYVSRDKDLASVWDTTPQMTSWEIAEYFNVNNIGGYNSFYAEDWDMIDVSNINYEYNAWYWINKYNLQNVYEYNIDLNQWKKIDHFPDIELINNKLPSSNVAYISNRTMDIASQGWIAGPSAKLNPGKYGVEIYGENLNNLTVTSWDNGEPSSLNIINHEDTFIECSFSLEESAKSFYLFIQNSQAEEHAFVNSFKIRKK